jgi:hypothetical protein
MFNCPYIIDDQRNAMVPFFELLALILKFSTSVEFFISSPFHESRLINA